jgi:hypothetical protein
MKGRTLVSLSVLSLVYLVSNAAGAGCGQTDCPSGYEDILTYRAGSKSAAGWKFTAKICTVEPAGGVISRKGDLIAVVEMGGPRARGGGGGFEESFYVNILDCAITFSGAEQLLTFRTGVSPSR